MGWRLRPMQPQLLLHHSSATTQPRAQIASYSVSLLPVQNVQALNQRPMRRGVRRRLLTQLTGRRHALPTDQQPQNQAALLPPASAQLRPARSARQRATFAWRRSVPAT
jgi:hypothetical protein